MVRKKHLKLLLMLLLPAVLYGCIGGSPTGKGHVTGQVTDTNGNGVPGIAVTTGKLHNKVFAVTDENGNYSLRDVPAGAQELLVAAPVGHSAGKKTSARAAQYTAVDTDASMSDRHEAVVNVLQAAKEASAPMFVTVVNGQTVTAHPVVLYPVQSTVHNTDILHVTPSLATPLTADSEVTLHVDVAYALSAVPEAILIVTAGYNGATVDGQALPITDSAGIARATLQFTTPHANQLVLHAYLMHPSNLILATSEIRAHPIVGHVTPKPPTLTAAVATGRDITVQWDPGRPVNFKRYVLYRREALPLDTQYGTPIWSGHDPNATEYVDTDVQRGKTYYYRLYLETTDGQLHDNGTVVHGLVTDFTVTPIPTALEGINRFVTDALRDKLYMLTQFHIGIMDTTTHNVEQGIPVNCNPFLSTFNVQSGFFLIPCNDEVLQLNITEAPSPTVQTVATLEGALHAVGSHDGRFVYISQTDKLHINVIDTHDPTAVRTVPTDILPSRLVISPDDSLLVAIGQHEDRMIGQVIYVFDTTDFTIVHQFVGNQFGPINMNRAFIHPTRNELYAGQRVYDLNTGRPTQLLTGDANVATRDGKWLFAQPLRFDREVIIYHWDGLAWTEHTTISLPAYPGAIALSPDETTLFVSLQGGIIGVIDLAPLGR